MRISVALTLALVAGCFDVDRVPGGPPTGYETDALSCDDGRDNDNDGLVDCQDPDCIAHSYCGEFIPLLPPRGVENDPRTCTDRIDNDVDGQFDCGDRGCQAIRELCCVTEFSDASCSNGVDDDGNGFFDCGDFACRNNPFVTVCNRENDLRWGPDACSDGIDNDGDRREDCDDEDCALDPACGEPVVEGPEDTIERCMDGFDNDGNGFTDCADFSCCGNRECTMPISPVIGTYCAERTENDTAKCTDGVDNDGNGFVDCREFGCCDAAGVCIDAEVQRYCDSFPDESTPELCANGVDDDGDGFIDCEDFSCSELPELAFACEASYDACVNGLDDEGDGFPDCNDFSCRGVVELKTFRRQDGTTVEFDASPCNESVRFPEDFATNRDRLFAIQEAISRCNDGIDGDSDGFLDCDDWDCQWNPLLNPRATGGTAPGLCQGGIFDPSLEGGRGGWRVPLATETPLQAARPLLCR